MKIVFDLGYACNYTIPYYLNLIFLVRMVYNNKRQRSYCYNDTTPLPG